MHQNNENALFPLCILHFLPELIISSKVEEVAAMCKFPPIRIFCAKAQISQKMHKKFYMMVIKLLLRFLKHKMAKLKPNNKKEEEKYEECGLEFELFQHPLTKL